MQRFTFQLMNRDQAVLAQMEEFLPDERAIWPRVARLADSADEPGARIRVLNERGRIVASLGVASAQRLLQEAA
jgi:hypothetical protein